MVYSDFVSHIDRGEVRDVTVAGHAVSGELTDGTRFRTIVPGDAGVILLVLPTDEEFVIANEAFGVLHHQEVAT